MAIHNSWKTPIASLKLISGLASRALRAYQTSVPAFYLPACETASPKSHKQQPLPYPVPINLTS